MKFPCFPSWRDSTANKTLRSFYNTSRATLRSRFLPPQYVPSQRGRANDSVKQLPNNEPGICSDDTGCVTESWRCALLLAFAAHPDPYFKSTLKKVGFTSAWIRMVSRGK